MKFCFGRNILPQNGMGGVASQRRYLLLQCRLYAFFAQHELNSRFVGRTSLSVHTSSRPQVTYQRLLHLFSLNLPFKAYTAIFVIIIFGRSGHHITSNLYQDEMEIKSS
jgi:hypothetical protein